MKMQEKRVQLQHFRLLQKQRQLVQLELMIAEFCSMIAGLEEQIAREEGKANIYDREHYAYPPLALAASKRQQNLEQSLAALQQKQELLRADIEQIELALSRTNRAQDLRFCAGLAM